MRANVRVGIVLLTLGAFAYSCKDEGDEPTVAPPAGPISFASHVQPIFSGNCTGCHSAGGSAPFSLEAGVSRGNIVNVQATSSCTSEKRVNPGNSGSSVLYKKISGTSCGTRMPRGGSPLSQTSIDIVKNWIDEGAADN
ncbi:MAG: hypothetical protein HY961_08890 [Ignavibacteriae bacterium]|nr:hypothetical protein [Ignavibacteriota bacterium]